MNMIYKVVSILLILGLVLFLIKPDRAPMSSHQIKYSSVTSPCSSSRVLVSFCSAGLDYTLTETQSALRNIALLFLGLLHFLVVQRKYYFPLSVIFKPPILD